MADRPQGTGDRVVSTVNPDARHTRKSPEARRDGYRAHMAADPETGIITDEKLTKAAGQETGRTLILHEHDGLLRAARADWAARTGCARTT